MRLLLSTCRLKLAARRSPTQINLNNPLVGLHLFQRPFGQHAALVQHGDVVGNRAAETEFTAELFKSLAGKHSLMVVEHDMGFVGAIADHVTVLHQGSVLAEGSLEQVQDNERVIEVYLGR